MKRTIVPPPRVQSMVSDEKRALFTLVGGVLVSAHRNVAWRSMETWLTSAWVPSGYERNVCDHMTLNARTRRRVSGRCPDCVKPVMSQ